MKKLPDTDRRSSRRNSPACGPHRVLTDSRLVWLFVGASGPPSSSQRKCCDAAASADTRSAEAWAGGAGRGRLRGVISSDALVAAGAGSNGSRARPRRRYGRCPPGAGRAAGRNVFLASLEGMGGDDPSTPLARSETGTPDASAPRSARLRGGRHRSAGDPETGLFDLDDQVAGEAGLGRSAGLAPFRTLST
jgi:hypothetical protein